MWTLDKPTASLSCCLDGNPVKSSQHETCCWALSCCNVSILLPFRVFSLLGWQAFTSKPDEARVKLATAYHPSNRKD